MFIREVKTVNKKTTKTYIKHVLVESVRVDGKPRQRIVMHLGRIDLPRELWPQLADELSIRLSGQQRLPLSKIKPNKSVLSIADTVMDNHYLRTERHREQAEKKASIHEGNTIETTLDDITSTEHRSLGPEQVGDHIWRQLNMPQLLAKLGFTERQSACCEALVIGRLVAPGSERATLNWLKEHSSIGELTDVSLDNIGRNTFYKMGDKIYDNKNEIEKHLQICKKKLYSNSNNFFLFDLTNFYFEGQALGNKLAARGKSKEKRSDAQLISLGLIVDNEGFPIFSKIFSGNVGEPSTLKEILAEMGLDNNDNLPSFRPTLAMDRGIATSDNIEYLKSLKLPYVLITRGPRNNVYLEEFKNYDKSGKFTVFKKNGNEVYLKKVMKDDCTAEILCVSKQRKLKEESMRLRWTERAMEDLANLQKSVRSNKRGTVKACEKILLKIGRLSEKYSGFNKYFSYEVKEDPERPGYAIDFTYKQKAVFDIDKNESHPLSGAYVIETTHIEKSSEEIWQLYMTLSKVENAFRCMKSELGTRPIYHQTAERTAAHLFISVIAYHLLAHIEYKLKQSDISWSWGTVRSKLATHQRSTIIISDIKGKVYHVRVSGSPEPIHKKIYDALKLKHKPRRRKFFITGHL
jgi:transposase